MTNCELYIARLLLKSRSDVKRAFASTSHGFLLDVKKQHVVYTYQSGSQSVHNVIYITQFITFFNIEFDANKVKVDVIIRNR